MKTRNSNKFWALIAILFGSFLLLSGFGASLGYLGLPLARSGIILGIQLGQMAAMFLGLLCGGLLFYHGFASLLRRRSRRFWLPPMYISWLAFALVLGLGNLLLNFNIAQEYLFPPIFLLGAALPTLAVLAWAGQRLGWPVTWRQAAMALAAGSTLSVGVTFLLASLIYYLEYLLILPLAILAEAFTLDLDGPALLQRLFNSPELVVLLFVVALQAPIPEELAKVLALPIFGRRRITNERQAFLLGMLAGAGFAILENMLYQGLYAGWNGWTWGGVTLIRGIGIVLHPLGTGMVALAWFRLKERGWGQLLLAYGAAVGLHTLWNGGFAPLMYLTGLDYFTGLGGRISFMVTVSGFCLCFS